MFICLFVELSFIRPSLWLCLSLAVADCLPTVSTHSQCITAHHSASQRIAENHIVLQFVTPCSNVCPQCQPTHSQQPTTVHHSASQCITANHIGNNINGIHQCIKGASQCTTVHLSDSHCKPECHPLSASLSCCDSPAPSSLTSQGQKAEE